MTVDPSRCPDCGAQITGAASCPSCGLLLRGPLAMRLWQVTNDIATLEAARESLLRSLRAGGVATPPHVPPAASRDTQPEPAAASAYAPPVMAPPRPAAAPRPAAPAPPPWEPAPATDTAGAYDWRPSPTPRPAARPPRPRKEWTPQRVQNLLLATGALLLVVAAIAFTAFTWGELPIPARGAIMLAVTGITGWAARWTYRRGLTASAEAIALLTVVFAAVDAYAARAANLGGLAGTDAATYWSVASGVLAVLAAGYGRVLPVRSVRYAALAAAQLPLALTAFRLPETTSYAERALFLTAQAALLALGAAHLGETALAARVFAFVNWSAAVVLAFATAYGVEDPGDVRVAAVVLALTGAVALLAPGDRTIPAGVATLLAVVAAVAPARLELTFVQLPAAVAAVGLLAVVAAASVPYAWRRGPVVVGAGTVSLALAAVVPWVGQAAALPFTWLERPWTLAGDRPAREALSATGGGWGGSVVTVAVLGVAVLALVVTADVFGRRQATRWWVLGMVSVGVLLVPLGFAASYRVALGWLVFAGVAGLAASYVLRRLLVAASATIVLGIATTWSLASEGATLAVLLAVAVAYAAYAVLYDTPREIAAGIAAAGAAGFALAMALSREAPLDRAGFVLATAAFGLLAAAVVLGGRLRSVELVAAAAYGVGLTLTATAADPGWLAWTLGGGALATGLTALRPSRRLLAGVSGALLAACAAATAVAFELGTPRAGLAAAATACAVFAAGSLLRLDDVRIVGAAAYVLGTAAAGDDVTWLAWALGVGAVTAGAAAVRDRQVAAVAAALTAGCAAATGTAAGLGVPRTGLVVAATACAIFAAGSLLRLADVRVVGAVAYGLGTAAAGEDVAWVAWALGIGALTAGAAAVRDRVLAPAAVALAMGCAGTTAFALGAPLDRTGFVVALAAVAAIGIGGLLPGETGDLVEIVAGVGYAVALGLAADDLGWLSWVLAAGGVAALANSLRPERRWQKWLATALLTAWTWDRLWIADVEVPEAYVAPVAILTLAIGHLRRRREPSTRSWEAYGGGLLTAFAPTTLLVFSDPGATRPVLLAVGGAVVLLAGVAERLQAPLAIGASVLAIDALVQLAPIAAAMPKWATIGALGLLIIVVGVTYEDRRRDMAKLRDTFESLT